MGQLTIVHMADRRKAEAPELVACIDLIRFLHKHRPAAFVVLGKLITDAALRLQAAPMKAVQTMRSFDRIAR